VRESKSSRPANSPCYCWKTDRELAHRSGSRIDPRAGLPKFSIAAYALGLFYHEKVCRDQLLLFKLISYMKNVQDLW
jgi:hypothetical protein